MDGKVCGNCKWHYAHSEAVERVGWKNCLALPFPDCTVFYSTPTAACSFPKKFSSNQTEKTS
jgi:hypothetical protein